jgi:hypothetical protein
MKRYNVDWQSIFSLTPPDEFIRLQYYCELVADRFNGTPERAIEIGAHEGASGALLSEWFDNVISIDPWGKEDLLSPAERTISFVGQPGTDEHFPKFMANMDRLGLWDDRVIPIVGTSKVLDGFPDLMAELVFADAGHVYAVCSKDIERSLRHLKPNGLLVVHDYKRPGFGYPPYDPNHPHHSPVDPYIGVQQAADEAIEKYDLRVVEHYQGILALERVAL